VRRLVVFVVVQALAVSTSMSSSLHVHQYFGHDHPDHHHGPAAHRHDHPAVVDRDHHADPADDEPAAWQAERCEPGQHAVSVSMSCACIAHGHVDFAELYGPTVAVPGAPIRSAVQFTDVRVHGPPFDGRIPARAPPVPSRLIT
jgi:hypothetical protein